VNNWNASWRSGAVCEPEEKSAPGAVGRFAW